MEMLLILVKTRFDARAIASDCPVRGKIDNVYNERGPPLSLILRALLQTKPPRGEFARFDLLQFTVTNTCLTTNFLSFF